ncbi:MAG: DUF3885 domain-containing protein [Bacillota bacterium]|nr:DUF3885 domain-containing protein [Bacillota bacterium]
MLLERIQKTLSHIGNERLQLPIFYESPASLRFETGDPQLDIFLTEKKLNPRYLRSALWRTTFLYEKTAPFDTLLWVLYRTIDLDTDVDEIISHFCRLTHLLPPAEIYHQEVTTAAEEPMTRILLLWDMAETPPKVQPLFEEIVRSDFKGLGFRELSSAIFFFDTQRHLLFHPYDDRGVDIVGKTPDDIRYLYEDCRNWLLEYDIERMQKTFAQK